MDTKDLYTQAENFLPWMLKDKISNATVTPYWVEQGLYYFQHKNNEKYLVGINTSNGEREIVINFNAVQDSLRTVNNLSNSQPIPISNIDIDKKKQEIRFQCCGYQWMYSIQDLLLHKKEKIIPGQLISPDHNWSLEVKNQNLILVDLSNNHPTKITDDGETYYNYATSPETNTRTITERLKSIIPMPIGIWSPDSKKIVTHKLDQRKVKDLFLLQNSPQESQRPKLHKYKMSFSGDEQLPLAELMIIDIDSKKIIPIQTAPLLSPYLTPIELKWVWWGSHSNKLFFIRETRGAKEIILYSVDPNTGNTEVLLTEKAEKTYVEPSPHALWSPEVIILENKIIWLSERNGYAHLYLIDEESSNSRAITSGEWCVRKLYFYDNRGDWLYFTACGFSQDVDPYYQQFFRCHLDGSDLECLTEENASHTIYFSPSNNCFLDTFSTINTASKTVLKKLNGETIVQVELANLDGLKELNWVPPTRFNVKARDGITDIYGNIYFPSSFDPSKKYPIIDDIYPGPQMFRTPTSLDLYSPLSRSIWSAQALAELGFIVIHLDGCGTPGRSKSFHDATYMNMGDCGIPDHVEAIKQLAQRYSFIEINRVGITGYSGGGYAAMRAMLLYPQFFKVCVSTAGNHDLRCYPANYGEKYNSLDESTYASQSNAYLANKLEGEVLLIHGEMDDNVHPCATLQLVDALIQYNKDFELILMPNQNHVTTAYHPYYIRKKWDFFIKNLLGLRPPKNYKLSEVPENFQDIF